MKIWITGYIGSGKSTISKGFTKVFEFDQIEILLRDKGYNFNNVKQREFKNLVREQLNQMENVIIEGIQCYEYYKKGEKVYFVKTNFLESMKRALKRDGYNKILSNFIDNIGLFFKLKILYIRTVLNNDIITNIDSLPDYNKILIKE